MVVAAGNSSPSERNQETQTAISFFSPSSLECNWALFSHPLSSCLLAHNFSSMDLCHFVLLPCDLYIFQHNQFIGEKFQVFIPSVGLQELRFCFQDLLINGTVLRVGSSQVTNAHQKFIHNFASGEFEGFLKKFYPFILSFGVMVFQPFLEGPKLLL